MSAGSDRSLLAITGPMRTMRFVLRICIVVAVLLSTASAARADSCGAERQAVKIGSDATAGGVRLAPRDTTIRELVALPHPHKLPARRRVPGVETQTWRVAGWITAFKSEEDGDIHVVLSDEAGRTMIVELPSGECAAAGRWSEQLEAARTALTGRLHGGRARGLHIPVTVTGVGFFDVVHGQLGVAANGIELHPVLAVEFR